MANKLSCRRNPGQRFAGNEVGTVRCYLWHGHRTQRLCDVMVRGPTRCCSNQPRCMQLGASTLSYQEMRNALTNMCVLITYHAMREISLELQCSLAWCPGASCFRCAPCTPSVTPLQSGTSLVLQVPHLRPSHCVGTTMGAL